MLACLLLLAAGCANRGIGPQGGPKDVTPPAVRKSKPENGALNYKEQKVRIAFNEYVILENVADNVVISPPQKHPAEVSAIGKKVVVSFPDTLRDNTTYTINFGSAIKDNNERNALNGYSFSFATGPEMDSLEIHGILLDAENLNPAAGVVVGIHENHSDTILAAEPFTRIGITNDDGTFTIHNIHPGTYRLYALQDISRDFVYQTGEPLAFSDSLFTPEVVVQTTTDTIWRDTLVNDSIIPLPDSIITAELHLFEPSGIQLMLFREDKQQQYLNRVLRKEQNAFALVFSTATKQDPVIQALPLYDNATFDDWTAACVMQTGCKRDTFTYWLTDSAVIAADSLRFAVTYLKSDSLFNLLPQTDTLFAVYRQTIADRNAAKKHKNDTLPPRPAPLHVTANAREAFDVFDTLLLASPLPVAGLLTDSMRLEIKQDTLWHHVPFTLLPRDSAHMRFAVIFDMQQKQTYRFTADSAALTSVYGNANDSAAWTFTVKSDEDYATLILHIEDHTSGMVLQLLNDKDEPLQHYPLPSPDITITHLTPASYYLRLFLDLNGDGKWTTGDWMLHRQPEPVFYFPKKLTLKENWDFEETFQWKTVPLTNQKPAELKSANKK